jgi:alpha-D-ribose 1-methylphosphonate 5-triphosphate diphosphatase
LHLITNARLLTRDEIVTGTVEVVDGRFRDVQPGRSHASGADDWEGDYLFPGLVELHTDNLEKHLEPRPGVRWPALSALLTHDAQISTAGITTVLDAMGVGRACRRPPKRCTKRAAAICCVRNTCCTCAASSRATTCCRS